MLLDAGVWALIPHYPSTAFLAVATVRNSRPALPENS
jgi:hypothetical protein